MALPWCGLLHQRVSVFFLRMSNKFKSNVRHCVSWMVKTVVVSGVQHVPGNAGGLHRNSQGGFARLALRAPHTAVKEDGRWSAGLSAGQSSESSRCHQVWTLLRFVRIKTSTVLFYNRIFFAYLIFMHVTFSVLCAHVSSVFYSTGILFPTISSSTS